MRIWYLVLHVVVVNSVSIGFVSLPGTLLLSLCVDQNKYNCKVSKRPKIKRCGKEVYDKISTLFGNILWKKFHEEKVLNRGVMLLRARRLFVSSLQSTGRAGHSSSRASKGHRVPKWDSQPEYHWWSMRRGRRLMQVQWRRRLWIVELVIKGKTAMNLYGLRPGFLADLGPLLILLRRD